MSDRVESAGEGFWVDADDEQARRRSRALLDAVGNGVCRLDADGRFAAVNDVLVELTGYERDSLLGRHVSVVLADAAVDRVERAIRDRLDGDDPESVATLELDVRTATGETRPCEFRLRVLAADGEFQGAVVVVRDRAGEGPAAESPKDCERGRRRELEQYRAVTEAANDVIVTIDTDSTIRSVNPAVESAFGYEPAELIGEPLTMLMPDRLADRHDSGLARYLETGERTIDWDSVELIGVRADGSETPVSISFSEIRYGGERFFTGIIRNVAERESRERKLARTERQLSRLMDNVPGMIYRCQSARDWPMEFVSDACEAVTGYDPESLTDGETSWGDDVMVQEDREMLWETVQTETAADGTFSETYRIETADGEIRWVRDYGRGIFDDDGNLVEIEGIVSDVTERKRTEQRLAEERDVFADGPVVVFRWEPDAAAGWPVQYVSENVESVLGYGTNELESGEVAYADLLHEADADRVAREVEEHVDGSTEQFSHDPYRVRTKDGHVRWVRDTTKIVRNDDGDLTSYLGYLVDVTERVEREQQLKRYETIVETVGDGIYVKDGAGRFTMVNDAYAELTGYDREELVGEHASLVVDEAAIEASRGALSSTGDEGVGTPAVEADLRTKSGDRVPAEATFATFETGDGEREEVGVVRDVSERKERERELQRTERRFEAIFEDPNILVGLLEPDGTVLDINRTAMEYIDADLAAVTGEPFWKTPWWGEGDSVRDEVREWTERAAAGEYVDFEADLTRPDGQRYTLSGYFRPVTDDDGEVVSIIVSDRDVTERKARERQLEKSEQRYRTLAEYFPNGIVTLFDHELRYELAAGRAFEELPVDPDDVEGRHFSEVWDDENVEVLEPVFDAVLEGEERTTELAYADRKWVLYAVPITDDRGEVFAGMTMVQDITEQVEHERHLQELVEKLEVSNERLEQFAYAASHDLQEPLRMVSSYLQLIENRYADDLDEDGREFIEFAVDGAERMSEMIEGLLAYSRVETQGDPLEPVDLGTVFDDVLADLQFRIEEYDAEITAEEFPRVQGDTSQLRQVFQNLLENAIEYSGDEPPRIHVTAERAGTEWCISVRDEGIGIDPDHTDRVFQVFQSLHSQADHGGTGIGLALVERIVERHGGEIWIESEPDEGATFSFTLPAVDEERE